MKTLIVKANVLADGHLRLDVPCDLPPGPVEICQVIQPETADAATGEPVRSTFEGCMAGQFPDETDIDAILSGMDRNRRKSLLPKR